MLLAFAIEFESTSKISLAICANVLRLISNEGIRVCDIPRLSGVSKEAIAASLSFLKKHGCLAGVQGSAGNRGKIIMLSEKGQLLRSASLHLIREIEKRWQTSFGEESLHNLREALESIVGDRTSKHSPLFRGLKPHPGSWRASLPMPATLPHYPMILHRGGFPDGS